MLEKIENKDIRIKLVAIAKDEAAYLPEWIFHHISMGFDEIEVLVNYTSDNSIDVLNKIGTVYPVKYQIIDDSIIDETKDFQRSAYNLAAKGLADGFDYLMFLDIDEFWTDSLFNHTIKDVLYRLDYPEALSFQWGIKLEANVLFEPCFSRMNKHIPSRFSRVIFKTKPFPKEINVHKVDIVEGRYLFSNGSDFLAKNKSELEDDLFSPGEIDRYFISHRVYRSEIEYVSLLGRGRPRFNNDSNVKFKLKDNRFGYRRVSNNAVEFVFDDYKKYIKSFDDFIISCDIRKELDEAKSFVLKRYFFVIDNVKLMPESDSKLIRKVFNRVETDEVLLLFLYLKEKWSDNEKKSKLTDDLRKLALSFEDENIDLALKLMKMAKVLRNEGPFINRKINEYENKIKVS